MKSFKQFVKEDVYGGLSTIFHRTRSIDSIDAIKNTGFKSGGGAMYGRAIYGTYLLKSQMNPLMKNTYGEYIIKAKVSNNRILFLDMDQAKKVYGKNHSLVDQLKTINPRFQITNNVEEISNKLLENPKYTSDIALNLIKIADIQNIVYGISFTGRRDGNVLVVYNEDSITPMSYNSTKNNPSKLDSNKWEDIKNINLVKKGLDRTLAGFYGNPLDSYKLIGGNRNDLRKNYKWVLDAKTKNVEIDLSKNEFKWIDGTWENGAWWDGTWKGGTWKRGGWENGTWENGTWENGTWNDGTWKDGTWCMGIWKRGTWNDGTWNYGEWYDGSWLSGTWCRGKWRDGTWHDGTWEMGIWQKGIWEDGTWKDGRWCYGEWCNGKWEKGVYHSGKWHNGTWLSGEWKYGEWRNGTWERGTWCLGEWRNGTWKGGYWHDGYWYDGIWGNGIWKNGTWENGTWERGSWEGGKWLCGSICSDKYKKSICSSVDPKTFYQYESESNSLKELQSKIK